MVRLVHTLNTNTHLCLGHCKFVKLIDCAYILINFNPLYIEFVSLVLAFQSVEIKFSISISRGSSRDGF